MNEEQIMKLIESTTHAIGANLDTITECREDILKLNRELEQLKKELKQKQAEGIFEDVNINGHKVKVKVPSQTKY